MPRVLVVDDDSWSQRMLAAVLAHDGHQVGMAADAREGMLAAEHVKPELLIVKARLPDLDGWELVARLRARPELAAIPTLFLLGGPAPGRRGESFRPETDDVLGKPFSAEALQAKVGRLLRASRVSGPKRNEFGEALAAPRVTAPRVVAPREVEDSGPRPRRLTPASGRPAGKRLRGAGVALVGRLDEFAAASILMLLELERRSGLLIISSSVGNSRVEVRRGRVMRASIEGQPECKGPAAVFQVLGWNTGRFEFHPGEVEVEDEVRSSTSFLLLEAARKEDEEAAGKKQQN